MMLRQFLHTDPVAVSYLLGCAVKGAAAIVDPVYPIEPYLDAARVAGTPIRLVIDTHSMPITDRLAASWPRAQERITRCMPRPRPDSPSAA